MVYFFEGLVPPVRWLITTQFMLELRARAEGSPTASTPPQLDDNLSAFHATLQFVITADHEDFGEPLYPVGRRLSLVDEHSVDGMTSAEEFRLTHLSRGGNAVALDGDERAMRR